MQSYVRAVAVGAFLVVVGACNETTVVQPDVTSTVRSTSQVEFSQTLPVTIDDEFAALSDSILGFGGWFVDGNGQPTVYLRDPSALNVAERRLRARAYSLQFAIRPG